MAKLIQCKDCGNQISKNAKACPNCGAKNKQTSIITWLALIFIGLPILFSIFSGATDEPVPIDEPPLLAASDSDSATSTSTPIMAAANWGYDESVDDMRNSTTYFAGNTSQNTIDIGFPYAGGSHLSITLRHTNEDGNEVMIITDNGQLWCEYSNCNMSVKFDDDPIKQYELSKAAAGSSETMFVSNTTDFINKLKSAKKTVIEIGFYDNGNQQFTFDTSTLNWPH